MRILVSCQHYWPEPFNTADVCEELVRRGHQVTVITGMPNTGMPDNDIPEEYRDGKITEEHRNGVRILRASLHPRLTGAKNRVLNYLTFWRNANKIARHLDEPFDVTFAYQFSPVMQADPALVYAKRHGVKCLLYSFDLWPASLLAGGFKEDSLPFKWMRSVSKRIYSQADRIAVTSPLFDEYFKGELQLDISGSAYLPQYADDAFSERYEGSLPDGYSADQVNLTFAGNVGQAQSVVTIVEAAARLRDRSDIQLHIVGSGSRLEACEKRARELGLSNITFHGRKPVEDMPAYYAASNAMLVTFEDSPMARYTLPRKVTTYLAAGKPVLAALSGETARVLHEAACGACCDTADADGLARIIRDFSSKADEGSLGANARSYYETHFTKDRFFNQLELLLENLTEENSNVR